MLRGRIGCTAILHIVEVIELIYLHIQDTRKIVGNNRVEQLRNGSLSWTRYKPSVAPLPLTWISTISSETYYSHIFFPNT